MKWITTLIITFLSVLVGVTVSTGVIFIFLNAVAQPLIGKISEQIITQQKSLMFIAVEMTTIGNLMYHNGFSNNSLC